MREIYVDTDKNYETVDLPLVPFPFYQFIVKKEISYIYWLQLTLGSVHSPKQAHLTCSHLKGIFFKNDEF